MDTAYISDVQFTSKYVEDQAPAWMNYTAAINGYAPVPTRNGFNYCEIGCGQGLTALILAALHPEGAFWAFDIGADHIGTARAMAAAAELTNIRFFEAEVGDTATLGIPRCEFITAHGFMSWVSADVRQQALDFIREHLAPGGLAMLSYDALPGFAPLAPIREMLQLYASSVDGDSVQKARAALEYVRVLQQSRTSYFTQYPYVSGVVDELLKQDPRYVVHELMTPHWRPFYFREMAEATGHAGLSYAGNLRPRLNYLDYMVAADFREFMSALPSRLLFESHHDLIANTIFRRDLYTSQPPSTGAASLTRADTIHLRYGISRLPETLRLSGQHQGLDYDVTSMQDRVAPISAALSAGPQDLRALHQSLDVPGFSLAQLADIMQALVVTGIAFPCADTAGERSGWPEINRVLVKLATGESRPEIPVVSPRLGVALVEPSADAESMQAVVDSMPSDARGADARRMALLGFSSASGQV
jgi:SAM-dependent methyltransferase